VGEERISTIVGKTLDELSYTHTYNADKQKYHDQHRTAMDTAKN